MKEKEWFEEWFDSPYYYVLYANRTQEEANAFVAKLASRLNIPAGAKILDAACGKGRHSHTLAKLGFHVTGIDLSHNSINYARQFESANLSFEVWDIRNVYKKSEFNYVLNLFSSFGYFDDDKDDYATVQAFADNLRSGGTLVIDYINTECAIKLMKTRQIVERGDIQFHIQKKVEGGFIKKKIEFLVDGTHHSYQEQLKVINLFKFKEMFQKAGLVLTGTFGDYELNQFDAHASPRLILAAKKIS